MNKRHIVVLGEALMDFIVPRAGVKLTEAEHIIPKTGGAPANVAVQAARLGQGVKLVTAVGRDPWGQRLRADLTAEGVDTQHVQVRAAEKTGLTFIEVDERAERTFYGWRKNAADQALRAEDIAPGVIEEAFLLHHGTVSLCGEHVRAATVSAVERARAAGTWVAMDVNLRFTMFDARATLLERTLEAMGHADLVKATEAEADALFGEGEVADHIAALHAAGAKLVFITRDKSGALASNGRDVVEVPAPTVREVDATGAGDAFWGAVLATLNARGDLDLDGAALEAVTHFACECGAAAVTALGATTGMRRGTVPTL